MGEGLGANPVNLRMRKLDSKVDWHKQPREIINAFWKIVCDKKVLQQKVDWITVVE